MSYRPGHRKSGKDKWNPGRYIDFRRPCWQTFYWLGVEAARHLPPDKSFGEIGAKFGLTKQNAHTACMLALGKVVFALRQLRDTN